MSRLLISILCSFFLASASAEVKIVTSIKPLELIAQAIQGQHGQVHNLLPPGASPHSFSLRPSDRKQLASADLFYWIGPDMEVFLSQIARQHATASRAVQQLPDLHLLYYQHDDDHGHDHAHDHHHLPGAVDTHLWLAPHNALIIARQIAADLSTLDAANAADYQLNLHNFEQRLQAADAQIRQQLADIGKRPFFVFHEAINYFEHSYQLEHAGVFAINPEVQPGAKHLQQMRLQLEQAGASCILTEPPAPPRIATSLSKDLPVRLQQIDVLGHQASSYEQLLLDLAHSMSACWQVN